MRGSICYRVFLRSSASGRLLSTAAARDIPINARSRRKISAVERKTMVEAYINEYRVMNAGKFPTAKNVQKQIGGGYYNVKAILQECEHNFKLSALATAAKHSTIWKTAQVNGSDAEVAPDCQVSDDRFVVVKEFGISADSDASHEVVVDKYSCQEMVDTATLNKDHEITTEYVSLCENEVNMELWGECDRTHIDKDISGESNILGTQEVPDVSDLVKNTSANEIPMPLAMDDSELPAKSGHHFEVTCTSRTMESEQSNKVADQAFESDESMRCRVMHVGEVPTVIDNKKQVGDSYYDHSSIIQEYNSVVGAEVNKTSEVEKTLDCQVRVDRTATVDDYEVSDGNDSSSQREVDDYSCKKMIDASILTKNREVSAEDICKTEKAVDLELKREHNKTSSTYFEGGEHNRSPESMEVSQNSSLLKETLAAKSLKATAIEDYDFSVKSSHPSDVSGTLQNSETGEIDAASAQATKFVEISRDKTTQKTQDMEQQESSLWGNLKFLASNMISFWRKR